MNNNENRVHNMNLKEDRMMRFIEGLTLLFIYLKLTKQIDWSWGYCLLPYIIAWAVLTVIYLIAFIRKEL